MNERANSHPPWLNDDEIARKFGGLSADHLGDTRCHGLIRQWIKLQQHDPADGHTLPNDQFAEIPVFGNQDTLIGDGQSQHFIVRGTRHCLSDGHNIKTSRSKAGYYNARDVLVCQKAHHSAARTVSCPR